MSLMLVSCGVAAASGFVAVTNRDVVYRIVGWFGLAFFILCAVIAAKRWLLGGVPFVFDLAGISFPTGSFGLLPWTEVEAYAVVTVRGHQFLAFTFREPSRVLSRVSAAKRRWAVMNQRLGWGHWALSFSGLTPGMGEAVAFIREHTVVSPAA